MRALLLVLLASAVHGQERAGDWGRPYEASGFPFFHHATTVGRASAAARYSARPDLSEAGPEVAYRLTLAARSRVTAWVQGDGGAVDVDVHVLSSLRLEQGLAADCVARGNAVAEAELPAGEAWVVVDTFEGPGKAGPYRLRIDVAPTGEWYERPVARGVTLRTRSFADLFGARQTASVLEVDPRAEGVRVKPLGGGGCRTPGDRAGAAGAIAALNAGFFGKQCASVSLLKVDGQLLAPNGATRSALGIDAEGRFHIERIEARRDWPAMTHAVGGVPRVVRAGKAVDECAQEGNGGSFASARHPRSAAAIGADGRLFLAAIDGRTAAGAGMSLAELGQWLAELGAEDALNLDGGGSTCLWVAGEPFAGVVNHPSDNKQADHVGVRPCDSVIAVWAEPLDRDAAWLAFPTPAPLPVGARFEAEVVAADPEGAAVKLELVAPPAGCRLEQGPDGATRLRFTPAEAGEVRLRVRAAVEKSRAVERELRLRVGE